MAVRQLGLALLVQCTLFSLSGRCAELTLSRFEFESKHMGTSFRIVLYTTDKANANKATVTAFARVAELDRILSDYNPNSEVMQLCKRNDTAPGKPIAVSTELFDILAKTESVSKVSDGSFDVTVGPLVKLWRLARKTQVMPDTKELTEAISKTGFEKVSLNSTAQTVTLKVPGMRLDFGGIGKGYAADEALAVLRDQFHISRALVAAYGDITCGDAPPDNDGWTVDITPISKDQAPRRLKLVNMAVSTSGDMEQFTVIDGVRYSHVLNPKTGLGLTGRRSVTVIAKKGWQADAYAKVASILPAEKSLPLIDKLEDAATYIVVKENDDAKEQVTASKRFDGYLAK